MKERLLGIAKWAAFPLFYLFCLAMFGYLTFPYGRLRDRLIAEFEKHGKPGQRLEIKNISSYWFTGVEVSGVKLYLPPDDPAPAGFPSSAADVAAAAAAPPPKETVISIDEAHARVRILPLLIGRVRVDFWASAFGGEIKGTAPVGKGGDVEVEIERVDIGQIEPLTQAVGLPMKGLASGKLALSSEGGKFSKATGNLDMTISGVAVGDGKTKIQGLIELPQAKLGDVTLSAEAKEGALRITKFTANGTDLELVGDGKIGVRDPFVESNADIYLRFKFTDAYRGKSATTKSLLGEPGSMVPGLMELQVPKMKRAKRPDGFYGWHVHGPLKRLKFDPTSADAPANAGKRAKGGTGIDAAGGVTGGPTKRGGISFPLGTSQTVTGTRDKDKDKEREKEKDKEEAAAPPATPTPLPQLPPQIRPRDPMEAGGLHPVEPPPAPAPEPAAPAQEPGAAPDPNAAPDPGAAPGAAPPGFGAEQ